MLLGPRVKAEVRLVGEVVRVKEYAHHRSFGDERLWLLALAAEHAHFLSVVHLRFLVAVRDLKNVGNKVQDIKSPSAFFRNLNVENGFYSDTK